MVPTVAGHLVPGIGNAADQLWVTRRDPAESEKGRLDPGLGKQVEDSAAIPLDAPRQAVPLGARDHLLERA